VRAAGLRLATVPGAGRVALPASGSVTLDGLRYTVTSLRGTAFPGAPLRVWLLARRPARTACGTSTATTVAGAIGAVGERLLATEQGGAATARVLRVAAHDPRLLAAVQHDDPAALRAAIVQLFRDPTLHVVRIRALTAAGTLVNDVGGPDVLAPASAPLVVHGRRIGRVTLSIQDDAGYIKLMRRFTGADVLLRTPAGQVPGSSRSPGRRTLPDRGTVAYRGQTYQVFSFPAGAFPRGPLRISLLVPPAGAAGD
jgi:hypothetical protein